MRIAVVDVGTNSTRLFIADVEGGRIERELVRESRVTRLGAGVDASGNLAPDAIERTQAVLDDYARQIADREAGRAVAVMTSAVRDAANGRDFAAHASERHGFDVHVLTGDEEARLTYRGATDELEPDAETTTLVLDIGGGSTELVLGRGSSVEFHVSTQAGVVRQADRHIHHDPPSAAELEATAAEVREILAAAASPEHRRTDLAIGVAGTPTSLAAIAQDLEPYDRERVHGYTLTVAQRDDIFDRLKQLPLAERRQVKGLHPDRAITILPGIVILSEAMALFGLESIQVSEHDILRGAALTFAAA